MNAEQIITAARERGILLAVRGGRIWFHGPDHALTEELICAIKAQKEGVMAALLSSRYRIRCLGVACRSAGYREVGGVKMLWCGDIGRAVLSMTECPHGGWEKNGIGRPTFPDPAAKKMAH